MKNTQTYLLIALVFCLPFQAMAIHPQKNPAGISFAASAIVCLRAVLNRLCLLQVEAQEIHVEDHEDEGVAEQPMAIMEPEAEEIAIDTPAATRGTIYLFGETHNNLYDQAANAHFVELAQQRNLVNGLEGNLYIENAAGQPLPEPSGVIYQLNRVNAGFQMIAIPERNGYAFGTEDLRARALTNAYEYIQVRLEALQYGQDGPGVYQGPIHEMQVFLNLITNFIDQDFESIFTYLYDKFENCEDNALLRFLKTHLNALRSPASKLLRSRLEVHYRAGDLGTPEEQLKFARWVLLAQLEQHEQLFPVEAQQLPVYFRDFLAEHAREATAVDIRTFASTFQRLADWRDIFVVENIQRLRAHMDTQRINVPLMMWFGQAHLNSLRTKLKQAGFEVNESKEDLNQAIENAQDKNQDPQVKKNQ